MDAIELIDVHKTYQDFFRRRSVALKGISLVVPEGEAFGFVGPNGAGKSTTIKVLTGMVRPQVGRAKLFGIPVSEYRARQGVAYVPENPCLPDYLSPLEILESAVRLHHLKVSNPRAHCIKWLERFDIAHVASKRLRGFSKGMAQRTALAHAMACQPRLLMLDEPLSGLDPIGRKDVVEILMEFRKQGGTVFFSSHVLHDVERLADRFGLIHKGELRTVQSPNELVGAAGLVTVRTKGECPVLGMQIDAVGRWYGEIEIENLWQFLDALRAAEHTIVEIKPRLSLEQAFFRFVQSGEFSSI